MIASTYVGKYGKVAHRVVDAHGEPIVYINSSNRHITSDPKASELADILAKVIYKWDKGEKVHVS